MLEAIVAATGSALLILLGAVGCVLFAGCANIANFPLARGAGQRKAEVDAAAPPGFYFREQTDPDVPSDSASE